MEEPCHPARRLVARGSICTVEQCSCGVLHVTLGVLTIRLQPEVVESLAETLGEALERLAVDQHARQTVDAFASAPAAGGRPS